MSLAPNIQMKGLFLNKCCSHLPSEVPNKFMKIPLGQFSVFVEISLKRDAELLGSQVLISKGTWRCPWPQFKGQLYSHRFPSRNVQIPNCWPELAIINCLHQDTVQAHTRIVHVSETPFCGLLQGSTWDCPAQPLPIWSQVEMGEGLCDNFCAQEDFSSHTKIVTKREQ